MLVLRKPFSFILKIRLYLYFIEIIMVVKNKKIDESFSQFICQSCKTEKKKFQEECKEVSFEVNMIFQNFRCKM